MHNQEGATLRGRYEIRREVELKSPKRCKRGNVQGRIAKLMRRLFHVYFFSFLAFFSFFSGTSAGLQRCAEND